MFDVAVTYLHRTRHGRTEVLLGEKLTGLGKGNIVGPGGKTEPGETPAQAAVREVWEEVGITLEEQHLTSVATITYPFVERDWLSQRSHVFVCHEFAGDVAESEELRATWWPVEEIPYHRMWADATLWLPQALTGRFITATIHIDVDDTVAHAVFS
jgi:8-oxo-dGTP diphosphatase